MNQLCKVCGEPAAGFHFGAFTCEGCKSFFGRTYNNLSSISECKNNGECIINKKNRTACKACRLRKCLLVGMSKSGSRYGRRSNWFKIHCLLQEQQHQQQQQQQQNHQNNNNNNNNQIQQHQLLHHYQHSQQLQQNHHQNHHHNTQHHHLQQQSQLHPSSFNHSTTLTSLHHHEHRSVDNNQANNKMSKFKNSSPDILRSNSLIVGDVTKSPLLADVAHFITTRQLTNSSSPSSNISTSSTSSSSSSSRASASTSPQIRTPPITITTTLTNTATTATTTITSIKSTKKLLTTKTTLSPRINRSPSGDSGASSAVDVDLDEMNTNQDNENLIYESFSVDCSRNIEKSLMPSPPSTIFNQHHFRNGTSYSPFLNGRISKYISSIPHQQQQQQQPPPPPPPIITQQKSLSTSPALLLYPSSISTNVTVTQPTGNRRIDEESTNDVHQNEPIDLSVKPKKRHRTSSPTMIQKNEPTTVTLISSFDLNKPTPLDLTLVRSQPLTG